MTQPNVADPNVTQLFLQLQHMIRELDTKFSDRIEELRYSIDNIKDDIKNEFVTRISNNEGNIAAHEVRLAEVEDAIESLRSEAEAATKANDLIIKGVPMIANECETDVVDIYCKIAVAIGYTPVNIPHAEIFRMGRKISGAKFDPPLLLKFTNWLDRKTFHKRYFLRRNLNLSDVGFTTTQRIFITENLTKQNQHIYSAAMKLRYEKKLWAVSTSGGVVLVRRREGDRPTPVLSINELSS